MHLLVRDDLFDAENATNKRSQQQDKNNNTNNNNNYNKNIDV